MKITETWKNRDKFIALVREKNPYGSEFEAALKATSKQELIEVIARNFSWCIRHQIIEEWLPEKLNVTELDCNNCTALESLPDMPRLKVLYCYNCTSLTSLPDMPSLEMLDCSYCTVLESLPNMPELKALNCSYCTALTSLPGMPRLIYVDYRGCNCIYQI